MRRLWFPILFVLVVVLMATGWARDKRQGQRWERTIDSLSVVLDSTKAQLGIAKRQADSAVIKARQTAHKVAEASEELGARVDTARAVLGDSTASQTRLRLTLAATVWSADRFRAEVLTYQAQIDTLVTTHLAERQAAERQIGQMQAVIDTQQAALKQARCSNFVGPCPTRWQAFGLGVGLGVGVAIVVAVLW